MLRVLRDLIGLALVVIGTKTMTDETTVKLFDRTHEVMDEARMRSILGNRVN